MKQRSLPVCAKCEMGRRIGFEIIGLAFISSIAFLIGVALGSLPLVLFPIFLNRPAVIGAHYLESAIPIVGVPFLCAWALQWLFCWFLGVTVTIQCRSRLLVWIAVASVLLLPPLVLQHIL